MSKQTIATLVMILLVTNYVAFQAGQTLQYYDNFARKASAEASATPGRGTRIYGVNQVLQYQPTRVDFGVLKSHRPLHRQVPFRNAGAQTVVIRSVRSSCGCTGATIAAKEIPPGGQGTLEIDLDPALAAPEFAVSISIEYDGRPQVDRILVSGQSTVSRAK